MAAAKWQQVNSAKKMRQRTAKRKRKSANTVEKQKLAEIAQTMGVVLLLVFPCEQRLRRAVMVRPDPA